jgi:ankyrin repeat protein
MKKILLAFTAIIITLNLSGEPLDTVLYTSDSDQNPFTFMNVIPAKVKFPEGIDLSFFVNQSIVFQYRFRIEAPDGKVLKPWTQWINTDINEVRLQKLDIAGRYKLVIEYRSHSTNDILRFEKAWQVYRNDPVAVTEPGKADGEKPAILTAEETRAPAAARISEKSTTVTAKVEPEPKIVEEPQKNMISQNEPIAKAIKEPETVKEIETKIVAEIPDYGKLLSEALEKKDLNQFREALRNGASTNLTDKNGGSIFHMISGKFIDEDLISDLKNQGNDINKPDNFGNAPLHYAILTGNNEYAGILIRKGADINIMNRQSLAPLHLAVLANNTPLTRDLISSGANVNLSGNTGYTPLHIAAELNNSRAAESIIKAGAIIKARNIQNLSALSIAKIQNNNDVLRTIKSNGAYLSDKAISYSAVNTFGDNIYPEIRFDLPYDNSLLSRLNRNKLIQVISVPVFAAAATTAAYLKIKSDSQYEIYKNSTSEESAEPFYQKANQYATYSMVAGGISVISLYSFIQATINKGSISSRLKKNF